MSGLIGFYSCSHLCGMIAVAVFLLILLSRFVNASERIAGAARRLRASCAMTPSHEDLSCDDFAAYAKALPWGSRRGSMQCVVNDPLERTNRRNDSASCFRRPQAIAGISCRPSSLHFPLHFCLVPVTAGDTLALSAPSGQQWLGQGHTAMKRAQNAGVTCSENPARSDANSHDAAASDHEPGRKPCARPPSSPAE